MNERDELLERIQKAGGDPVLFAEASVEELRELAEQYERAAAAIKKHGRLKAIWLADSE